MSKRSHLSFAFPSWLEKNSKVTCDADVANDDADADADADADNDADADDDDDATV